MLAIGGGGSGGGGGFGTSGNRLHGRLRRGWREWRECPIPRWFTSPSGTLTVTVGGGAVRLRGQPEVGSAFPGAAGTAGTASSVADGSGNILLYAFGGGAGGAGSSGATASVASTPAGTYGGAQWQGGISGTCSNAGTPSSPNGLGFSGGTFAAQGGGGGAGLVTTPANHAGAPGGNIGPQHPELGGSVGGIGGLAGVATGGIGGTGIAFFGGRPLGGRRGRRWRWRGPPTAMVGRRGGAGALYGAAEAVVAVRPSRPARASAVQAPMV